MSTASFLDQLYWAQLNFLIDHQLDWSQLPTAYVIPDHHIGHLIIHRACHHTSGISSPTGHVISLGISSPTGHLITHWTSHQPPKISSATGHLITHRTSHYPPNISSPTVHFIPPDVLLHRACHPTEHVIPYFVIDKQDISVKWWVINEGNDFLTSYIRRSFIS